MLMVLVVVVVQVEHAGVEKVLEVDRYNDRVSVNLEKHKDHQKAAMAANYIDRETQKERDPAALASYCAASLHRLRLISLPDLGACACACACVCAGMMAARAAEKRQQIIGTFVAGAGR